MPKITKKLMGIDSIGYNEIGEMKENIAEAINTIANITRLIKQFQAIYDKRPNRPLAFKGESSIC